MHDIKWIREAPEAFDAGLARRGIEPQASRILEIDAQRRSLQTGLQEMQARRNEASREIGQRKKAGAPAEDLVQEVALLKDRMAEAEQQERALAETLAEVLASLPNQLAEDVPDGADERHNVELRTHGAKPSFDFSPKEHYELGEALGGLDFEAASKLAGSRFVVLRGAIARLHRALAQFMLDLHTGEHGYTEVAPPYLVRDEALFGTGQLPKFADDQFRTLDGRWLIPTSEVPLTNLVAGDILDDGALPLRVTALTPCFRLEAGAAGRDTRGMLRQHQFEKVEMVSITRAEESDAEQQRMTACAEEVLKRLGLHYRVVVLCSGDTGFGGRRTFDIEVWLPGQEAYREISSCSTCGDFQARRMNARYRTDGQKGTQFVHTLNGSGVAVGRALIAVLENYQEADGGIVVPQVLRPYMAGRERIAPGEALS